MGRAPLPLEEAPLLLTSAATSGLRPARLLTLAAARAAAALVTATAAAAAEAATAARDDASAGRDNLSCTTPPRKLVEMRPESFTRLFAMIPNVGVVKCLRHTDRCPANIFKISLHRHTHTCCRLDICDGSLLASHHKALPFSVCIVRLLIVLVRLVDELEVQLALAALTRYAGLQARASRWSA